MTAPRIVGLSTGTFVRIGAWFRRLLNELRHVGDWRLSTKLVAGFMLIAMAAILFFTKQNETNATQAIAGVQSRLLSTIASSVAVQVETLVLQYRRDTVQVATDPEVVNFMGLSPADQAAAIAPLLSHLGPALKADPDYRVLLLMDPAGHVRVSSDPALQGTNVSSREFFAKGLTATETMPYISDVILGDDRTSQVIYTSSPINDIGGHRILGVVAVQTSAVRLASLLQSPDIVSQHRNAFLVSQDGVILANSVGPRLNYHSLGSLDPAHANAVTKQFGLRSVPSLGLNDLAAEMANAPGGGVATAPLLSPHETDVISFAPVPSQRWAVMVAEDRAIFTADVSDLSRTQFFNAFVLALIIGGLVIFVGRAFDTTERESLSDPLTGLANRRFLQEILLRELRRAQRSNQPFALMIVDIDHFKVVNDTYGHNAGDEMLEQLAGIMLSSVRATDFVVRYGGEEFVILLPETRLADAQQVAEKLRKTIGESVMESTAKPGVILTCTVSAGVSMYPVDAASGEGLILKADKALYFAKQHGRNRVVTVAEAETPSPDAPVAAIKS
jgi:diguanylate cyclase (GGDEF)-like protein